MSGPKKKALRGNGGQSESTKCKPIKVLRFVQPVFGKSFWLIEQFASRFEERRENETQDNPGEKRRARSQRSGRRWCQAMGRNERCALYKTSHALLSHAGIDLLSDWQTGYVGEAEARRRLRAISFWLLWLTLPRCLRALSFRLLWLRLPGWVLEDEDDE